MQKANWLLRICSTFIYKITGETEYQVYKSIALSGGLCQPNYQLGVCSPAFRLNNCQWSRLTDFFAYLKHLYTKLTDTIPESASVIFCHYVPTILRFLILWYSSWPWNSILYLSSVYVILFITAPLWIRYSDTIACICRPRVCRHLTAATTWKRLISTSLRMCILSRNVAWSAKPNRLMRNANAKHLTCQVFLSVA